MPPTFVGMRLAQRRFRNCFGIRAGDVVLGEAAQVENADAFPHRHAFVTYHVEDVIAAVAVLFFAPVQRVPFGPLPAEGLGEHAALCLERLVRGTEPLRSAGRQFFAGQRRGVGQAVILEAFGPGIVGVCVNAEAARVETGHVDFGIAVQHPLREELAAAGALRDAERRATTQPEILQARDGPEIRRSIGRMRDRAVDDALDAGVLDDGQAFHCIAQPGHESFEVVGNSSLSELHSG